MELDFEAFIIVGFDKSNNIKKCFTVDYELKKEDLEEFAKEEGYKDFEDLVNQLWDKDEYWADDKARYLNDYKEGKTYLMELEIGVMFNLENELKKFLVNKYQSQFEWQLLDKLTIEDNDFDFSKN